MISEASTDFILLVRTRDVVVAKIGDGAWDNTGLISLTYLSRIHAFCGGERRDEFSCGCFLENKIGVHDYDDGMNRLCS